SNTARSSAHSSNGSSFGPRRGTDAPAVEVTQHLTINYWRRTLEVTRQIGSKSSNIRRAACVMANIVPAVTPRAEWNGTPDRLF
ncbi:hypothetical protein, partial [Streptomyces sp. H39-C1]|uniref:hypothetical protein n=1 Tax=Streptomyces sp. H39-C1 TaxID=3004355 RepID=UPI0022AE9310